MGSLLNSGRQQPVCCAQQRVACMTTQRCMCVCKLLKNGQCPAACLIVDTVTLRAYALCVWCLTRALTSLQELTFCTYEPRNINYALPAFSGDPRGPAALNEVHVLMCGGAGARLMLASSLCCCSYTDTQMPTALCAYVAPVQA